MQYGAKCGEVLFEDKAEVIDRRCRVIAIGEVELQIVNASSLQPVLVHAVARGISVRGSNEEKNLGSCRCAGSGIADGSGSGAWLATVPAATGPW